MFDPDLARHRMVERQIAGRGVTDARVLQAMRDVRRENYIVAGDAICAYEDTPLAIEAGQTISQPYIVALMLEAVELRPADRALEIGTGSGYAAAVLSHLCADVWTMERHTQLAEQAMGRLRRDGRGTVRVHVGDGTLGLPEAAPFDAILVTAAGPRVPPTLKEQLAVGGRLTMPVGDALEQRLLKLVRRSDDTVDECDLGAVAFVPLIGIHGVAERER